MTMVRRRKKTAPAEVDTTNGKFAQGAVRILYVPPAMRAFFTQVELNQIDENAARAAAEGKAPEPEPGGGEQP